MTAAAAPGKAEFGKFRAAEFWKFGAPADGAVLSVPAAKNGTACPARTGDPQIHNLVL
jgi:hypothetical protein